MPRSWWFKVLGTVFFTILCLLYLVPSFVSSDRLPKWAHYIVPKQELKLGLDLQGGLHIVMGIDPERVVQENTAVFAQDLAEELKSKFPSVEVKKIEKSSDIEVIHPASQDVKELRKLVRKRYAFEFGEQKETSFVLHLSSQERSFYIKRAVEQSIEAIRNRIDEFGVAEPSIVAEGSDRIVIQLPGVQDPARAKELIGRTAKLEFKLVDASEPPLPIEAWIEQVEKEKGLKFDSEKGEKFSDYLAQVREALKDKIPKERELAFEKQVDPQTQKARWIPYLLEQKAQVTGDHVRDARVVTNPRTNLYDVSLKFTAQGAKPFAKLTSDNVNRRLAIVLDGMVHSAPRIDEPILNGEASITFGARDDLNQLLKEVQDTALVLRAGALPTTIELLEERTVGPSLGADSIAAGKKSLLLGLLLVVLMMVVYYKVAGVVANVALVLNLVFLLALLAMFGATLTMPGIAGIVLTLGMAVDANVLIFERIREEIRSGKSAKVSIQAGFEKAWSSILDANLTTMIAALALLSEGTGPVKGFAVTLTIGICTSVFSAVFISKLFYDFFILKLKIEKVSI
ncbi:MAG: protein translocase subunit SecD [Deltaproteobacteria bacterium]|nr:protein translocase subunit SecD [Deltaproteobacteria bacterium]